MDRYDANRRSDAYYMSLYNGTSDFYLHTLEFEIFQLYVAREKTDFNETRDKVTKLMQITVQTGFLTSVLALLSLAFRVRQLSGLSQIPCVFRLNSHFRRLIMNPVL